MYSLPVEINNRRRAGRWVVKVVIVFAAVSLLTSVVQLVQAFTEDSPSGSLSEVQRNLLGVLALQSDYPRSWLAGSTILWASTLVAAMAFLKGIAWGRHALQAILAVMIAAVILATFIQHQSLTFVEDNAQNPSLVVVLKAGLWALGGSIAIVMAYAIRWLSSLGRSG